mmetsp:Transcript_73785/g.207209  ORF Transcript_73785/g.207209 Transcript_73785/m.207209 type:complete len:121 (-) Transcript_73785:413-775(-)|eukprot:CAMPEP_0176228070 /NCGR_PEP_ID=MMETSP0121_2-20121125/23087_1 /TAXON_ID=160619 /ORGANISM="Kryptoperidinium foliaceum, Strain CCMP 1326" /LENGTH=120 /DNA_ID=CAMNT_0017567357 /DNA_START=65 /DNA_END=427 /DNA_ORIENTATION=-
MAVALRAAVNDTLAHIDTDVDIAPSCRCLSHPPSATLLHDSELGATLARKEEPAPQGRRKRPGKKRRASFQRLVDRLVEKTVADPAFDALMEGGLPPSVASSSEKMQKLRELVAKLASIS